MSHSQSLDELIHSLVIKHPVLSVQEIAVGLWGEGKHEAKTKRLYRQINPYDDAANFKAVDLPRLSEVLNTDEIVLHQARRRGLAVYRIPDVPAEGRQEAMNALAQSIKEFGEFVTEAAASGDQIEKEGYEAIVAIAAMMALARREK